MKRLLSILLVLTLTISLFTGCQKDAKEDNNTSSNNEATGEVQEDEVITLKFFDKNTGDAFGEDPVSQEIIKRTGVKLEMEQPTGDPNEKLNLMLASGDLPDILLMDRSSSIVTKYIDSGAIIPLNDLIEEYGPNVKEMYGNILVQSRYKDGKNYYLNNWYGFEENEPVLGFLMHRGMLEEIVGEEKANDGSYFTQEEFVNILKKVQEKYPELNGQTTIPFTIWAENWGAFTSTFKGMYGMKKYYEPVDGQLQFDFKDPRYLEMIKFANKLYREGLLEEEWAVNKKQLWEQKCAGGYTFATVGAYWDLNNVNTILRDENNGNPDAAFYSYKVVADGVDPNETTYGPRSGLGWDAIAISKTNKYPEKTMQFIDFLASEEGQYLLMWGLEGEHWTIKDGKHVPNDDVLPSFQANWDEYKKQTGIRRWTWFVKNGPGSDGTPYDLAGRYERSEYDKVAIKNLNGSTWDAAPYEGLEPESGSAEALMYQKIQDLEKTEIPKAIYAKTEEECVKIFNEFLESVENAGASAVEKVITENYKTRLELWK